MIKHSLIDSYAVQWVQVAGGRASDEISVTPTPNSMCGFKKSQHEAVQNAKLKAIKQQFKKPTGDVMVGCYSSHG